MFLSTHGTFRFIADFTCLQFAFVFAWCTFGNKHVGSKSEKEETLNAPIEFKFNSSRKKEPTSIWVHIRCYLLVSTTYTPITRPSCCLMIYKDILWYWGLSEILTPIQWPITLFLFSWMYRIFSYSPHKTCVRMPRRIDPRPDTSRCQHLRTHSALLIWIRTDERYQQIREFDF